MKTTEVRIRGTINDVVEVEHEPDATEEEIIEKAELEWRYVEFEDLKGELA